jgi:hypothetical protein
MQRKQTALDQPLSSHRPRGAGSGRISDALPERFQHATLRNPVTQHANPGSARILDKSKKGWVKVA